MKRDAGFAVDAGNVQSFVIPADGGFGNALFEEALRQPGVGLHDLREGMSAIEGLAGLLQFSDGLIEQAHFAESDAEVVMRFGIFVGGGNVGFEIVLEFAKHFGEIDAGVFAERRSFGGGWSGRRVSSTGIGGCGLGASTTGACQATDAVAGGAGADMFARTLRRRRRDAGSR